ncbi:hypothetical protein HDV04_002627 [Boothiomyces sp. JEL0838]|nr:hypothetical protein HDV04_002627 [Boothiomyces sp. JEL0838]
MQELEHGVKLHSQNNFSLAFKYIKLSADKGNPIGIFLLGMYLRQDRGHDLEFKLKKETFDFIQYEELKYENVVLLDAPANLGGPLRMGNLIDFVNYGGNVILASSEVNDPIRDFGFEFSVDYASSLVSDYFAPEINLVTGKIVASEHVIPKNVKAPVYKGIGHSLSGKNKLVQPVLVGNPSAFSGEDAKITSHTLVGSDLVLVSAFQALNQARVVFTASSELFKDIYPQNKDFVNELTAWAFKEKSVLKVQSKKHHRQGETGQHGIYRIKDDMVYEVELLKLEKGKYVPFTPKDVQFEAVMLDPYIRQTMVPKGNKLVAEFKLPDHYGVFTFKVDYKRHGLTYLNLNETVQIRPYRHDQYPRFLTIANPYYVNVWSMFAAFFLFTAVVLYHRDTKKVKKE